MQRVYDGLRADLLLDRMKAEGMVDETKPGDFEVVIVKVGDKDVEVRVPKTEQGIESPIDQPEQQLAEQVLRCYAKKRYHFGSTLSGCVRERAADTAMYNVFSFISPAGNRSPKSAGKPPPAGSS